MTSFLQKKRKLNLNDSSPKTNISISLENTLAPVYFNYSPINFYHSSSSHIEELVWNENYQKANKKFIINRTFNLNHQPKEKNIKYKYHIIINALILKLNSNKEDPDKKEKEYINHCLQLKNKNYNIKQIIEMNQIRKIQTKKFNLILDIDSTLIRAIEIEDYNHKKGKNDVEIKGRVKNIDFHYFYRYRPYVFEFVNELKDYFNFYISTLSHKNYASKILNHFKSKANIIIPERRISSKNDFNMSSKNYKYINELISLNNNQEICNTVIIDDNVYHWLKPDFIKDTIQSIKSLIPSKRYVIDCSSYGEENGTYDILIHNNVFENVYDQKSNYILSVDYTYCMETDSDINRKLLQLFYIELFLKKCIKFSLFSGISIVEAMNYYRKKIFEYCKFYLKYLSNSWSNIINLIIKDLGGNIANSSQEATHFVIEKKIDLKKIFINNTFKKFVNINYILQCYFNLNKFDESDKRFI